MLKCVIEIYRGIERKRFLERLLKERNKENKGDKHLENVLEDARERGGVL